MGITLQGLRHYNYSIPLNLFYYYLLLFTITQRELILNINKANKQKKYIYIISLYVWQLKSNYLNIAFDICPLKNQKRIVRLRKEIIINPQIMKKKKLDKGEGDFTPPIIYCKITIKKRQL